MTVGISAATIGAIGAGVGAVGSAAVATAPYWGPAAVGYGLSKLTGGGGGGSMGGLSTSDIMSEFPKEYEVDPIYDETQDYLKSLGIDILGGDIPDYYAPIGEVGGKEFEDAMSMGRRDISQSVLENQALRGSRGGAGSLAIAKGIGDYETQTRYADWQRAMQGRAGLFDVGRGITENVRGSAANMSEAKNRFQLDKFGALAGFGTGQQQIAQQAQSDTMGMIGGLSQAAGTYLGYKTLADSMGSGSTGGISALTAGGYQQPSTTWDLFGGGASGNLNNTFSSPSLNYGAARQANPYILSN